MRIVKSLPVILAASLVAGTAVAAIAATADAAHETDNGRARLMAQMGHDLDVVAAAFSPDGRLLLTADDNGLVNLWDVKTGRQIRKFEHDDLGMSGLAFSPDGERVLAVPDENAFQWDVRTGELLGTISKNRDWEGAFSSDGKLLVTGDRRVRSWDAVTGQELLLFDEDNQKRVSAIAISSDGSQVLTGDNRGGLVLWDAKTGHSVKRLVHKSKPGARGHREVVTSIAFAPDGTKALTSSEDYSTRLWDLETGQAMKSFDNGGLATGQSFSPDGRRLLVLAETEGDALTYDVALLDAATYRELSRFGKPDIDPTHMAFSADGAGVLVGFADGTSWLWAVDSAAMDSSSGTWTTSPSPIDRESQRFEGHLREFRSAAFLSDSKRILTMDTDSTAYLWDGPSGRQLRRFVAKDRPALKDYSKAMSTSVSPDFRKMVNGYIDGSANLVDLETGEELWRVEGLGDFSLGFRSFQASVHALAFSPDGRRVAVGVEDFLLLDSATGEELQRFVGHTSRVLDVKFSRDGRLLLTGNHETARIWDTETGEELQRFEGSQAEGGAGPGGDEQTDVVRHPECGGMFPVAFSRDESQILTNNCLWDRGAAREVKRFEGWSAALSDDGKRVLTATWNDEAEGEPAIAALWDVETGDRVELFQGHDAQLDSVAFSPDGRFVLTASQDRTTRVWDAESGQELARLLSFTDGTWAVVDREGRFDGSNAGDIPGLHFVVGLEPIELAQLKERYFEPGLLSKVMGFNVDEKLRDVEVFNQRQVKLFPEATVTQTPSLDDLTLGLDLANRGGGIGRVAVFVNGKEVTEDARPAGARDPDVETLHLDVALADSPLMRSGGHKRIEFVVYSASAMASLRQPGGEVEMASPPGGRAGAPVGGTDPEASSRGGRAAAAVGGHASQDPPTLWAVVAGVSDYAGDIDLSFASKDADDFARALRLAAAGYGFTQVNIRILTDGPETSPANRANLVSAFEWLRGARPSDVLVVYLAGHGVTLEDDYYYLLKDATNLKLEDEAVREQRAISSRELVDLIKLVLAEKQVLILDTCAAGQAIKDLNKSRAVSSSQARAMDKVKDRTGMFVLAGSAANASSYEATEYGQGLLTYSLLEGMQGRALENGLVDVQRLFTYSQERVPILAGEVGGIQQPQLSSPPGGTFHLGLLDAAAQQGIILAQKRPMVLRASFQDENSFVDDLKLVEAVNEALDNVAAQGRDAPLVFVEAESASNAYQIRGRYTVEGQLVELKVRVIRNRQPVGAFEVEGQKNALPQLVDQVMEKAKIAIGQHFGDS